MRRLLTIAFEVGENINNSEFIEMEVSKKQSNELLKKLKEKNES